MEDDKLTVTEILNGLLRKEYIDHRAQLFQLLVNLFADENESDSQQLIVKSSNSLTANNNNEESNLENEKDSNSSSTRPLQVNKETYRQLLRILLEFTDEKKFSHEIINLSLCVLVNATIKQEYIEYFLEFISTPDSGNPISVKFHSVIDQYLSYNPQFEADDLISSPDFRWEELDQYQQVGNILANLCQQETGRKLILRTSTGYMLKLPSQVRSRNSVRRRGAVACIRSCLFDQDYHWWMLNEVKVLTPLLIPLVVPTPFNEKDKEGMDPTIWLQAENPDKKCEPDFEIMKLMVDCLILLCQRRGIREELRKRKVYPIMRNLDLKVEDENVTASIYEVVNFLIADEDPSTPIDHDDSKTPI